MTPRTPADPAAVLTSWKEIARYMGKGVRTVQRWEQDFGLPVRRPTGSDKKAVLARPRDLDMWVAMRCATRGKGSEDEQRDAAFLNRTQLAIALETSRILRAANRVMRVELRAALIALHEQLKEISKTAA